MFSKTLIYIYVLALLTMHFAEIFFPFSIIQKVFPILVFIKNHPSHKNIITDSFHPQEKEKGLKD